MHAAFRGWIVTFSFLAAISQPARAADVNKYLPDDTGTLVVLNVRQVLDAPVVKKYLREQMKAALQNHADSQPLLGLFDPDALKDLDRITLAVPAGEVLQGKGLVVVEGRFDLTNIQAVAQELAQSMAITLKIHPHEKTPLHEILLDDPPKPFLFAAFLDKNLLVVSPGKEPVLEAIAKHNGKRTTKLNKDLQALIARADARQHLWVAGRVADPWKRSLERVNQLKLFAGKLESFSGGVRFTETIKAGFFLQLSDVQAAVDLRQMLENSKGLLAVVIATSKDLKDHGPLLNDILNALQFSQAKGTVAIELALPEDLIEKGFKKPAKP
jgi:hypothetical protein